MGVSNKRKEEICKYLSKENLIKAFNEGYSSNYIAKKYFYPDFKTTAGVVIEHAEKFNIRTPTLVEAANSINVKNQKLKTVREKYGVRNVSQCQKIKDKKEKTNIKNYGVSNVFQSEIIKNKSKNTLMSKYGVTSASHLGGPVRTTSKFQKEIENILSLNYIEYESEVGKIFKKYNECLNREYSPIVDIKIKQKPIVIECYGDIWHANPNFYKPNDIIIGYKGKKTASEIWNKDEARIKQIESFGYKVIIIWHSDWRHNKQLVEQKILNVIKNQIDKKD